MLGCSAQREKRTCEAGVREIRREEKDPPKREEPREREYQRSNETVCISFCLVGWLVFCALWVA